MLNAEAPEIVFDDAGVAIGVLAGFEGVRRVSHCVSLSPAYRPYVHDGICRLRGLASSSATLATSRRRSHAVLARLFAAFAFWTILSRPLAAFRLRKSSCRRIKLVASQTFMCPSCLMCTRSRPRARLLPSCPRRCVHRLCLCAESIGFLSVWTAQVETTNPRAEVEAGIRLLGPVLLRSVCWRPCARFCCLTQAWLCVYLQVRQCC